MQNCTSPGVVTRERSAESCLSALLPFKFLPLLVINSQNIHILLTLSAHGTQIFAALLVDPSQKTMLRYLKR